ncbi:hypothetical protein ACG33_01970 [Steroidobacter denitrificans]|uniref:Uncharacterized protein n=1 Tax=Steroidobacter denitrificans TaxID=465721 RepID=A0A127F8G4_STEDE|nr:hypothetical protein [Steroidobacter denitrificans]AMN45895.1 hypothetical protein ACG33_01970 [Steroidobacter denitrificans]
MIEVAEQTPRGFMPCPTRQALVPLHCSRIRLVDLYGQCNFRLFNLFIQMIADEIHVAHKPFMMLSGCRVFALA